MKPSIHPDEGAMPTSSAVYVPHRDLASCVRAFVTRSTLGAKLHAHERHNFYPASIACGISWTLQGQTALVRVGDQECHAMAPSPIMFTGPHSVSCETHNPGPVQFFLLMFMPDSFHALTGVNLQAHTNQHLPLHAILGLEWQNMAKEVMTASDDAERIRVIEAFLLPRWQAVRPQSWKRVPGLLTDWARNLGVRWVSPSTGRSQRQNERRIKQWTGQTQRQLNRIVRGEDTFLRARTRRIRNELVWSDLAADGGFSDQSHFCREFRELTGLRPEDVMRNMDTDERLWVFRAWAGNPPVFH